MKRSAVLLCLALAGSAACFQSIEAPGCKVLSDCPAGQGYTACEDGHCFREGRCDRAAPEAGDGCCARLEGDRSADTDCLSVDLDLRCRDLQGPVADGEGTLFVACRTVDATGAGVVHLRSVRPDGTEAPSEEAGPGARVLPPLVSRGSDAYVAVAGGIARFDARQGGRVQDVASDPPSGGLAAVGPDDVVRPFVGWPTVAGDVVLYDEDRRTVQAFPAGPAVPGTEAFPPVVSARGRRMLVLWRDGRLVALSTVNPVGPVAMVDLPGTPVAGPVELDGRVLVALQGGLLAALAESGATFQQAWQTDLGGEVAGGLLVDPAGTVTAVLDTGAVVGVRDLVDRGSLVGRGDSGTAAGPLHPLLGAAPRVVAFGADGRRAWSVLRQDQAGGVTFRPGLSFAVPVEAVGMPLLAGRLLWMATASGHLVAWQFPDDPPGGRFWRAGSDAGGTGRTSPFQE